MTYTRDYAPVAASIASDRDRVAQMRTLADLLWDAFGDINAGGATRAGVSWVGFYVAPKDNRDELILSACRNKPACSPIGMHGACGRSFLSRRPLVVTDVAHLGEGYVACDPRDRSELVVPLLESDGTAWGVFDADSFETGAFTIADALAVASLVHDAGLSPGVFAPQDIEVV